MVPAHCSRRPLLSKTCYKRPKRKKRTICCTCRKEEEARINDALDRGGILNVAIAEPPTVPALPARSFWLYGLLSVFLAGTGSVGLAFTSDFLDPSFRTPDEVAAFLESPVLASLPKNGR